MISSESMLNRQVFSKLEEALDHCTLSDENHMKSTLKVAYLFLLKRFAKIIIAKYLTEGRDEDAAEAGKFSEVLELNQNTIFGGAEYKMLQRRQSVLRRPINLPADDEVLQLREYITSRIDCIVSQHFHMWDSASYSELRDLALCRLTIWNV